MLTTSALYRLALPKATSRYVRVELWRSGVRIDPATNLPAADPLAGYVAYTTGSVRGALSSRVTRTLSMTMHERWYPWGDFDAFNPWGDELRVFAGVRFADGYVEAYPIFTGRISKTTRPDNGSFQLDASDLAAEVAAAGFVKPQQASTGAAILSEFRRLVLGGFPDAEFGTSDDFHESVPNVVYDTDRGKALDSLAGTVGAFWFTLGDGKFVMRRIPWLQHTDPLLTLTDGPGGTLTKAAPTRDRSGVSNSWTLVSEPTNGQGTAIYATEEDVDPKSPIYVHGPFGRKSKTVRVDGVSDDGQLRGLAKQYVSRGRALAQSWSVESVPDASLELGDVHTVQTVRGPRGPVQAVQVINGFTYPLNTNGRMPLDLRALQPTGTPVLVADREAITYRRTTTVVNTAAPAASYPIAIPSDIQPGDKMYMIIAVAGTTTVTRPSWWTLAGAPVSKDTVLTVQVWERLADEDDIDWVETLALSTADQISAVCVGVRSTRPVNLVGVQLVAESAAVSTHAAPAVAGYGDGLAVVSIFARATIAGTWAAGPQGDIALANIKGADTVGNNAALLVTGSSITPADLLARTATTPDAAASICVMGTILLQVEGS